MSRAARRAASSRELACLRRASLRLFGLRGALGGGAHGGIALLAELNLKGRESDVDRDDHACHT